MLDTLASRRYIQLALMVAILLVAMAVRVHQLDAPSLWYDEGVAYAHSQRSLAELIPRLRDNVHVPAYFGTLALYEDAVGSHEFSLRSLSLWFSLISISGVYALGKRLFGGVTGMTAAALVTFNTFNIHYAQETRMYAMLSAIAVLSMWCLVGLVQSLSQPDVRRGVGVRWGLALALLNTLGAYTHISYALVMLAQGVLAVLWLGHLAWDRQTRWRTVGFAFAVYTLANLLTLAFFAPWMGTAIAQIGAQPNISATLPLQTMGQLYFGRLTFGITYASAIGGMGAVLLFLMVFALVGLPTRHAVTWWAVAVPLVWVGVSLGVYHSLGLYDRYFRFLLPVQLAVALWVGRGIGVLWHILPRRAHIGTVGRVQRAMPRVAALVAGGALCIAMLRGLPALYDPHSIETYPQNFIRDDYRGLAQQITTEARADDAIILSAAGLQEIFGYYYAGDLPIYPLPNGGDTAQQVQQIIDQHDRIFAVFYGADEQDPDGEVQNTLNRYAYPISAQWVDSVQLRRYATPTTVAPAQAVDVAFGDHITLESVALSTRTLAPQSALQVRLHWSTSAPLQQRYKVFLHLLDADGRLVVQRDSEPADGRAITPLWAVDDVIVDPHALAIGALPAGPYQLIVGLYDLNQPDVRLMTDTGDHHSIGTITIE